MRYPYECPKCDNSFEVIKALAEIDNIEYCGKCGCVGYRSISRVNLGNTKEYIANFNPAFGKVVKSQSHQKEIIAELRGKGVEMEEIGNEPLDKLHSWHDKKRDDIRKEKWDSIEKENFFE